MVALANGPGVRFGYGGMYTFGVAKQVHALLRALGAFVKTAGNESGAAGCA